MADLKTRGFRMTKTWKGKIAIDIWEASPDWEPYIQPLAPEGAPNILYIV